MIPTGIEIGSIHVRESNYRYTQIDWWSCDPLAIKLTYFKTPDNYPDIWSGHPNITRIITSIQISKLH